MSRLMATRTGLVVLATLAVMAGLWLGASQTVQAQSRARVVLDVDDSDNLVAPGAEVDVHIWVRSPVTGRDYSVRFFHAVGGPAVIDQGTRLANEPDKPSTFGAHTYITTVRLAIPLGTPDGKATLSAMIDESGGAETESLPLGRTTVTIGEAGDPVGSARISAAIVGFKTSGSRSSTSLRSTQTAYLKLEVKNSRGKITDDREVESIIITATGGILSRRYPASGRAPDWKTANHFIEYSDEETEQDRHANALTEFSLRSLERKPIHIDVYAYVIGKDGSVRSNTLVVNFAGKASGLTVGEPSGALAARHGDARIVVSGIDSDGNADDLSTSQVKVEVTGGPEGADLSLVSVAKASCSRSATDCDTGEVVLLVKTTEKEDEQAAHGRYEVEVELSDTAEPLIVTTEVVVVGEPVMLSLELLDGSDPAIRRIFTRTRLREYVPGSGETEQLIVGEAQSVIAAVTLHDEDGERISTSNRNIRGDGVTFQAAGSLSVTLLSRSEQEIVDGVAYVRFLVVGDEGSSLLLATSRDLVAHVSMVGREKARFGLDGFTRVERDNMTTWIASNTIRVSELYPKLRARRIKTVSLWHFEEKRWLRYAMVDDVSVPGSVDFAISYADTLWLAE